MDTSEQAPNIGRGVLQAIFAVFLGLMITAVVGVGVYTFYPNPADPIDEQVNALYEERAAIECPALAPDNDGLSTDRLLPDAQCRPMSELTVGERARMAAIDAEVRLLQQKASDQRQEWSQRTSVVLIVIATALMALSLALGDSMSVLSNGILLGGLFTMLYGVGWGLASGNSLTRFLVLVAALAVSVGLGYLKFSRRASKGSEPPAPGAPGPAQGAGEDAGAGPGDGSTGPVADLEARVADLERRLASAAALLGQDRDPGSR